MVFLLNSSFVCQPLGISEKIGLEVSNNMVQVGLIARKQGYAIALDKSHSTA